MVVKSKGSAAGQPGRPSKLTPERQERLVSALKAGASRIGAANFAGIGETTMRDWMRLAVDDAADGEYRGFRRAVLEAEAIAELSAVVEVRKADPKWFLSRRFNRWRDEVRSTVTHQGPGGAPVAVTASVSSPELVRLLDLLTLEADAKAAADDPTGPD